MRFPRLNRLLFAAVLAAMWMARPLPAQPESEIAALEKRIAVAAPAEKFTALLALSRALESDDTARATAVARDARKAAPTPHDELLADARLATVLRRRGEYPEAFAITRAGLARAIKLCDDAARGELLVVSGQINGSLADYPAALDAYQQLIAVAEKSGNRYFVARGQLGLSFILADTGEPLKARAEEELVVSIAQDLGNSELEADGLNNLGNNFRAAGELDRARDAHERALALRSAAGNRRGVGDSLINLAAVARARRDLPGALDCAQRALAIYEQLGLKRYQANTRVQLATFLRLTGRLDEALAQLNTVLALTPALNSHLLFADLHHEFSLVFEARGDARAALEAQRRYATETEAALGEKSRAQMVNLKARYDAQRHEQELVRLRATKAIWDAQLRTSADDLASARFLERILFNILVLLGVAGIGALGLLFYRIRVEHRAVDE
jgi:tetratricopeptide (TPR) repeat protein